KRARAGRSRLDGRRLPHLRQPSRAGRDAARTSAVPLPLAAPAPPARVDLRLRARRLRRRRVPAPPGDPGSGRGVRLVLVADVARKPRLRDWPRVLVRHVLAPRLARPVSLFVGSSGWSYPSWKPAFYPPGSRSEDFLGLYAERLPAVELNSTGYRLPSAEQFR